MDAKSLIVGILSGALMICLSPEHGTSQPDPLESLLNNSAMAQNDPDQFNWRLFVLLARPAETQTKIAKTNHFSRDAIWESWADDFDTFPLCRNSNTGCMDQLALYKPKWKQSGRGTTPHPDPLNLLASASPPRNQTETLFDTRLCRTGPCETTGDFEVRRNQAAFQTIVGSGLWYREAIAKWAQTPGATLEFNPHSIEVKAYWIPIEPKYKSKFHWNYGTDGKTIYGLKGLHIMTNTLPGRWTWATWEWTGVSANPQPGAPGGGPRCEYTGCTDTYGSLKKHTPQYDYSASASMQSDRTLPLQNLFAQYIPSEQWRNEWRNYRLKGTQIITNGTLQMPLLGDSSMEVDFLESSSCMSCHARAGVTTNGKPLPIFVDPCKKIGAVRRPQTPKSGGTDFVWAFVQAQPMSPQPSTPTPDDPCP